MSVRVEAKEWLEKMGCWLQQAGGQVEWTIIRPGGLKNDTPTGNGVLTTDKSICGAINREDVAELVVKALFSDKANGKVRFQSAAPIIWSMLVAGRMQNLAGESWCSYTTCRFCGASNHQLAFLPESVLVNIHALD